MRTTLLYIFLLKLGEAIATKAEQLPPPNDSSFFDDCKNIQSTSLPLEMSEGLLVNTDPIQTDSVKSSRRLASNGVLDRFVIYFPYTGRGEAIVYKLVKMIMMRLVKMISLDVAAGHS